MGRNAGHDSHKWASLTAAMAKAVPTALRKAVATSLLVTSSGVPTTSRPSVLDKRRARRAQSRSPMRLR